MKTEILTDNKAMKNSKNTDKFFNNIVSENYSDAHKFLGEVINKNVASKISKELKSTLNEGIFDRIKARAKGAAEQGKTYGRNIKGSISNVGKGIGKLARGEDVKSDDIGLYKKQDPMLNRGKVEAFSIASSIEKDVQDFLDRAKKLGTINRYDLDEIEKKKNELLSYLKSSVNPSFNQNAYDDIVQRIKYGMSLGKNIKQVYNGMKQNPKWNRFNDELEKAFKDVSK